MDIPNPYAGNRDYRLYMAVPLVLMAVGLFFAFVTPGLERGIDLKGGLLITLQATGTIDEAVLKADLSKYSGTVDIRSVSTGAGTGIEIELENNPALETAEDDVKTLLELDRTLTDAELAIASQNGTGDASRVNALRTQILSKSASVLASIGSKAVAGDEPHAAVQAVLEEQSSAKQNYRDTLLAVVKQRTGSGDVSFREVGSSLSKFFLAKTREIVTLALILASLVVFFVFRALLPSFAVVFGAIADVTMTMGVMSLLGIPLTLATVATLLMLIGFAIDTHIMLSMRILKRKEGTAAERAFEAMGTGFLMNLTTIGAFGALWLVSRWLQIPMYEQIGAVAVIGGFADFIAAWLFSAPLVLQHAKKSEPK